MTSMRPKAPSRSSVQSQEAEILALQALAFLAADSERLERFLALTGLDPAELRHGATRPELLGAILDHLLNDESLLLIFAETQGISPEKINQSRHKLPGASLDF